MLSVIKNILRGWGVLSKEKELYLPPKSFFKIPKDKGYVELWDHSLGINTGIYCAIRKRNRREVSHYIYNNDISTFHLNSLEGEYIVKNYEI